MTAHLLVGPTGINKIEAVNPVSFVRIGDLLKLGLSIADLTSLITPLDLSDAALFTGVLPTARGGTSVDIASAALPLGSGQIAFPAIQNPSADPNTQDDYEEGEFTPEITFAVPGDLAVTYTLQKGHYTKWGNTVRISFNVVTATFTHGSASGVLSVTGAPFSTATIAQFGHQGPAFVDAGFTWPLGTSVTCRMGSNTSAVNTVVCGSGLTPTFFDAADTTSGVNIQVQSTIVYHTD